MLHRNLSPERWMALPKQQQVLMIANELNRAGNWIEKNSPNEVNACYERALELCDLTGEDNRWRSSARRELRRLREQLAEHYISTQKDHSYNYKLYRGLLQIDHEAWNLLSPENYQNKINDSNVKRYSRQ